MKYHLPILLSSVFLLGSLLVAEASLTAEAIEDDSLTESSPVPPEYQDNALERADAQSAEPEHVYSIRELEQLLAPIALYPDVLLAQVLIASTYPLEVVQARRWLQAHPGLQGQDAVNAAEEEQSWDPSVVALMAFPSVLEQLDDHLTWTEELGNAFLLQEEDVLVAVQNLRSQADSVGNLDQQEHITVQRVEKTIIIEPADPTVIYVPYYSTRVIYGYSYWGTYHPVYWAPPRRHYYAGSGIIWVHPAPFVSPFFYASFYWPSRSVVVINRRAQAHYGFRYSTYSPRYATYPRWQHDPRHRRGVVYPPAALSRHHTRISGSRTYLGHPDFSQRDRHRPPPPPRSAIRPESRPPSDARMVRTRPGLNPPGSPPPPRPGVRPGFDRPPPPQRDRPISRSPDDRDALRDRLRQTAPGERPMVSRPPRPDWNQGRPDNRTRPEGFRERPASRPDWQSRPPPDRRAEGTRPSTPPQQGQRPSAPPPDRQTRPAPPPTPPPPTVRTERQEQPSVGRFTPRHRQDAAPPRAPARSGERSAPPAPPRPPRR